MKATTLSKIDTKFRDAITRYLPPKLAVQIYSIGRKYFLSKLKDDIPQKTTHPEKDLARNLWGINFRSPIMNAAGMFKSGDGYEMVARQGAGAYLGGTGTWNYRDGNSKNGIHLPFVPYPLSGSSSSWMGLPNPGDMSTSMKISGLVRVADTPIGWSIMASPDLCIREQNTSIVRGMNCYQNAGVDFLELNVSCPNIINNKDTGKNKDLSDLEIQLLYVSENYIRRKENPLPIIVKFSNDKTVEEIPYLMDLLFENGFSGVNFGNTSTDYYAIRNSIDSSERRLFDYFTKTFGGGISGKPLKERSLELCALAVEYMNKGKPSQEFHVIRTGGIEGWNDIIESERVGVKLNQWFTGYFENFSKYGHDVYAKLYANSHNL